MQPKEAIVSAYREKLSKTIKLDTSQVKRVVDGILKPYGRDILAIFDQGRSVEDLKQMKENFYKNGRKIAPAQLTAFFLIGCVHDQILRRFLEETIQGEDKAGDFLVWHDFALGFREALTGPLAADLPGGESEQTIDAVACFLDEPQPNTEELDRLRDFWQRYLTWAVNSMREDPTGVSTIEKYPQMVKEKRIAGELISEFVIAGSEFAIGMYKVVYPQASSLYN